ncbi:hypothetical protein [Pelagibacterium sp.]|uniref:hypothetical protein n=1 Tax=Pelagibacterium sp. TaxID=1967288 RepID=UPI003A90989F
MAKIFFAWVDTLDVVFNPSVHGRVDESFRLIQTHQEENHAARGRITFPNPGVGLLSASRRRFALISESESGDPEDAVLTFRARTLGMPTDLQAVMITTELIAAPEDLDARLKAKAAEMYGLPFTDPLFGDDLEDTSAALSARGASWFIDPRTHEITITDVLESDTVVDIGTDHAMSDYAIAAGDPPVRAARMKVAVEYEQRAIGYVDIKNRIGATSTMSTAGGDGEFVPPPIDVQAGVGWEMGQNAYRVTDSSHLALDFGWRKSRTYRGFQYSHSVYAYHQQNNDPFGTGRSAGHYWRHYFDDLGTAQQIWKGVDETRVWTYDWEQLLMTYDYRQMRREEVEIRMSVPTQDVLGAVAELDLGEITLRDPTDDPDTPAWYPGRPGEAGDHVLYDGRRWQYKNAHALDYFYFNSVLDGKLVAISTPGFEPADSIAPLPDARSPTYLDTPRGVQSIEHALLLIRARLRYRLRCLKVQVRPNNWEIVRDIRLDQDLACDHPRFGPVRGKVIRWERSWDGSGGRRGTVTVGACLGTGATGAGQIEDVQYATSSDAIAVPVNAFSLGNPAYAVTDVDKAMEAEDQADLANTELAAGRDPSSALTANKTAVTVSMRPLASIGLITRGLRIDASLQESPMGYDAGAS